MKKKFDYSRLRGRIREKCNTERAFSNLMGIAQATLITRWNGETFFTQKEIVKACEILDIPFSEILDYFFAFRVQEN